MLNEKGEKVALTSSVSGKPFKEGEIFFVVIKACITKNGGYNEIDDNIFVKLDEVPEEIRKNKDWDVIH